MWGFVASRNVEAKLPHHRSDTSWHSCLNSYGMELSTGALWSSRSLSLPEPPLHEADVICYTWCIGGLVLYDSHGNASDQWHLIIPYDGHVSGQCSRCVTRRGFLLFNCDPPPPLLCARRNKSLTVHGYFSPVNASILESFCLTGFPNQSRAVPSDVS